MSVMKKVGRAVLGLVAFVAVLVVGFVAYVSATYKRSFADVPLPNVVASKDAKVIAQGEYIAHAVAHCSACHGPAEAAAQRKLASDKGDLRGGYTMKAGPFGTFYPANLTSDAETGLGRYSDAQIARVIRHGVAPDGTYAPFMAFAVGSMADEDLTAVVSYLRTLPPIKNAVPKDEWGFIAKALASKFNPRMDVAPKYVAAGEPPSVERGAYLAGGPALCRGCHSPMDAMKGFALVGTPYSGSMEPEPDGTDPAYEIIAPNLTPDPKTGALASFSEDGFVTRIRAGRRHAGSVMPWENFAQMTEADLRSLYRFLKSLPPTVRNVGETRRPRGTKVSG